jgi:hypothetical protein
MYCPPCKDRKDEENERIEQEIYERKQMEQEYDEQEQNEQEQNEQEQNEGTPMSKSTIRVCVGDSPY